METKIIITGLDPGLRENTCGDLDAMAEKLLHRHAQIAGIQFKVGATTLQSGVCTYSVAGVVQLQRPHVVAALETGGDLCKSIETVADKLERMLTESTQNEHKHTIEDKRQPAHGVNIPEYAMANQHPG